MTMIEYDLDEFKKRYPHIAKELEEKVGVRSLSKLIKDDEPPFIPTAIDYLRRCKTLEEAREVLNYLVSIGELKADERQFFEEVLSNKGLESLGPRKEFGYYSEKYAKISRSP